METAPAPAASESPTSKLGGAMTTLRCTATQQRQAVVFFLPPLHSAVSVTSDSGSPSKHHPQVFDSDSGVFFPRLPHSPESELKNLLSPRGTAAIEYFGVAEREDCVESHEQTAPEIRKKRSRKIKVRVENATLKRLLSGAFAGAVSRTAVAPLETVRTHLMVGSGGKSVVEVFSRIAQTEGWRGLFRGNGINVIRVAPSKAIELFAYDTVKKVLTPRAGESSRLPVPISSVAGAAAGVCSTLCTYPLELMKTRMTIQRGLYDNLFDAFIKIYRTEGFCELYRGLTPTVIGVIPYASMNYFAYETLRRLYRKLSRQQQIGNLATLLIGSAAGAIASSATFPLEVARKQMQVGALGGRQVYRNLCHALASILEQQGPAGLYRGLGASCIKLVPAAGISFMCYEACKGVLFEEEQEVQE